MKKFYVILSLKRSNNSYYKVNFRHIFVKFIIVVHGKLSTFPPINIYTQLLIFMQIGEFCRLFDSNLASYPHFHT